jgi:uncharacterized membrane protein (UPF0127 family)/Skp family chaperone for outer membrane proteins
LNFRIPWAVSALAIAVAIAIGVTGFSSTVIAQDAPVTHLGAVNLSLAYSNLQETIDIDRQLQAMQDQLKQLTTDHQTQMQALQKKINDVTKSGGKPYEDLVDELDLKTLQFASDEQAIKSRIQRTQNHQLKHGFDQIQAVVNELAQKQGLDAVINKTGAIVTTFNTETAKPETVASLIFNRSMLYNTDAVDLTADVIAQVNKNYKSTSPLTPSTPLATTPIQIGSRRFTLEIAGDDSSREKGLMERDSNPPDHGMIFVFATAGEQSFWMHHTRFPLDIIFADEHGKIVSMHAMKPYDETPITSDGIAKYAIELPGGQATASGVKPGDSLNIPAIVDQSLKTEPPKTDAGAAGAQKK